MRDAAVVIFAAIRRVRAELLTGAALLAGLACITAGVARLTSPVVWLFAAGLLFVSLAGWRLAYIVARDGLYTLTRPSGDGVPRG